jgi:hypothetical protein
MEWWKSDRSKIISGDGGEEVGERKKGTGAGEWKEGRWRDGMGWDEMGKEGEGTGWLGLV